MRTKTVKKCILALVVLFLLLTGGYGGYREYRVLRQRHLLKEARQFLAAGDRENALLCLEGALQTNPRDPEASRMMADLAEHLHSPAAMIWRGRAVEYNPGSYDDRLSLAETAIKQRDYAAAAEALNGVKSSQTNQASFQNVAGALAAAMNQRERAVMHFREVARLEPANPVPLLNIAVLQIQGSNAMEASQAHSFLRGLASNPTNAELRVKALRELTVDAMRHRQANEALTLSKDLLGQTNPAFGDQLLRLDVLNDTRNAEYATALASAQQGAASDPAKVAELASWEAARRPPAEVLGWLLSLSKPVQANQAVAIIIAQSYDAARDWPGLQNFLKPQSWGAMDFARHAFLARALRGQDLVDSAKGEWDLALKGARGKQDLTMLLRSATQWDWRSQQEELLWTIVEQYPRDKAAFQVLAKTLFLEGRTRSLLKLYNEALRRGPADLASKNNVAFAALLLDAQEFKPYEMAHEVYTQAPTNSACVATYALSLYLQKKNAEAIKVIESLGPQGLGDPSAACVYGLALNAIGERERARKYLEFSSKVPILPEQRKLVAKALDGAP